jgi:hypothetical protein
MQIIEAEPFSAQKSQFIDKVKLLGALPPLPSAY